MAVTATPAPITSQLKVKLSLLLQVSLANFIAFMQQSLREQMAVTVTSHRDEYGRGDWCRCLAQACCR